MKHLAQIQIEFLKLAWFNPYLSFETHIRGQKFIHPMTRNRVDFHSLPKSMQQMIKSRWEQRQNEQIMDRIRETATTVHEPAVRELVYA
jgi:hypothetical protein